jgi:hypothetical protein
MIQFPESRLKNSFEKIVKNHDNSKKREARKLTKMQATATDSKIQEHTKPDPVSAAQDENACHLLKSKYSRFYQNKPDLVAPPICTNLA